MRALCISTLILTSLSLGACTRSTSDTDSSDTDSGGGDAAGAAAGQDAPLTLTDARLDKYIAYRKEYNQGWVRWTQAAVDVAKSVEGKSTDVGKGIAAVTGAQRISEQYEKEINALRAKHGFTEREDDRLWAAVEAVVAAKALDNPMMGEGLKSYREMQARGGEEKKMADEFLKGLEDQEKEGLAEAQEQYGKECVDILVRRVKDLGQLQMDLVQRVLQSQTSQGK